MKKKVSTYIDEEYGGSVTNRWIINRINNKEDPLKGVFEAGLWFVLIDEDSAPPSTGNPRADKILGKVSVHQ
jgi:hypothetical protein